MVSNTDIDHFADLTAQLVKQPWQQVGFLRSQGSEQPSCPSASSVIKSWSCGPAERVDLVLREAVYPPDTHRFLILMAHSVCMLALHCSKYDTALLPNGHPIQNSAVGANFRSQASDLRLLQQVQRLLRFLAFPAREDSRVVSDCSGRAAAT